MSSLNPPSVRFPFNITGKVDPEVENAIRWTFNGFTNHEQAFDEVNGRLDTLESESSSSSSSSASTTTTEVIQETTVIEGTQFGGVDNQTGQTSYATRQSDGGSLVIINDSSAVAVTLTVVTIPWACVMMNTGSGAGTLTPASGTISYGTTLAASSMPLASGSSAMIFFDGSNFWGVAL